MRRAPLLFAIATVVACADRARPPAPTPAPASPPGALDRAVRDLCDRQIVLLGEPSHGEARTFEIKTELVRRLVDECHFSAVLFESGVYDFVELERALDQGRAAPAQLANAVGAMWSAADELQPLLDLLWRRATASRVRLGGLDDQLSSTALFAQRGLPRELAAQLDDGAACETELARFTSYQYDDVHPYDASVRDRLLACLAAVEDRATGDTAALAAALRRQVHRSLDDGPSVQAARDRSMFEALRWHVDRLRPGTKLIVWCATVHAARTDDPALLGAHVHAAFGARAAAVAFTALAGNHGRIRRPVTPLEPAPADSLEARAFASPGSDDLRYLDRTDLAALGPIAARPIDHRYQTRDWSTTVDAIVVIRDERAPHFTRGTEPQ